MQWELRGYKRKPGLPRKNWMGIVRRHLNDMDTTWDEAEELATLSTYSGNKETEQNGVNMWPNPHQSGCGMNYGAKVS